ncbi:hypothetical protein [Thalassoroseus pseudoceratinae]|uniref:hypothetical protein n=1 Tax=Thalassoroseus pseudoceratinae TaxID=2713176 RepID=UPI001424013F|nr:hypothetical protein [Thalassoroseus pseudoceratinae]
MMKKWETYEEVAAYLLDQFASAFGLSRVEGKQDIEGQRSGTKWQIDGKGVRSGDEGFMIVECRRFTTSKQNQERIGALAYRIIDSGADGGILVSPLGLQKGAEKIANAENITDVYLNEHSTCHEYTLKFLNRMMVGIQEQATAGDSWECTVFRKDSSVKSDEGT